MGTSLLRMELFGEQRKAAGEVVGHPASPGCHRAWQLLTVDAVSRLREAGTWELPGPTVAPLSCDRRAAHRRTFLLREQ